MRHRVLVLGSTGRMGREVVQAVTEAPDMELVGGLRRGDDVAEAIRRTQPTVVVDFTIPEAVLDHIYTGIRFGVPMVVGTTGLSQSDLEDVDRAARERGVGLLVAPNFSLGAVLMMKCAALAARHFPHVEIIELHHDGKKDAPSGTALRTAELVAQARGPASPERDDLELCAGARGGNYEGVRIHSVRLPGLVAHQEVILGLPGETLRIRHDSVDRRCFMPGVLLAIRRVHEWQGLVYGLEQLLFPEG
ncbi:MAG TPA: 4-hydroxy-tetrahydrodipicolinate reductase [Limnochordales bacterium]|nr:4-hydroxy-tetrahydrodipicolinate reductase [Limnochordales bacterium]